MKTLTIEQLQANYERLLELINKTFSGDRRDKLLKLYEDFADRLIDAPASGKEHYHYAIPGGYILHILHVVEFSEKIHNIWKESGAYSDNYTLEELLFAALHHDFGKLGDDKNPYYIPNESEWHRINQGSIYDFCKDLEFMDVPLRSIYILQKYGITISSTEMLGIMLSDGLYDDSNKSYLITFRKENKPKTNVPYIIHQADFMACQIENNEWQHRTGIFAEIDENGQEEKPKNKGTKKDKSMLKKDEPQLSKKQKDIASVFSNAGKESQISEDLFKDLFKTIKND